MHGFPPQVSSRKQSYRVLIVKSALRQLAGLQNEKFDELEMCELFLFLTESPLLLRVLLTESLLFLFLTESPLLLRVLLTESSPLSFSL